MWHDIFSFAALPMSEWRALMLVLFSPATELATESRRWGAEFDAPPPGTGSHASSSHARVKPA